MAASIRQPHRCEVNRTLVGSVALAALLASSGDAAAQRVRGVVLLPDSATPAAGAIVVASDAHGAVAARALTSERGAFELRVPGPGRYDVRVLRIGFRPTILPAMEVPAEGVPALRIVVRGAAVSLAVLTVRGNTVCRIRQDSGQLVSHLWDEAGKAITATQLAASGGALVARWRLFDRAMDRRGETILAETGTSRTGTTSRPFVSIPPDSLAAVGYVTETAGDVEYFGPDADVLLSDSFAALHCFHAEPPPKDHPDWIGIAFVPARQRRGITEIEGTLWVDRETSELRLLEYRYAGLRPEYAAVDVGGFVEFLRLPTGGWLVSRWAIRMPRAHIENTIPSDMRATVETRPRVIVDGLKVSGGEVETIERDGALLFTSGEVTRADTAIARAGAPDLGCGERSTNAQPAFLYGLVYEGKREPLIGAHVRVTTRGELQQVGPRLWTSRETVFEATTGEFGLWSICDVPRERLLTGRATYERRISPSVSVKLPRDRSAARVDIEIPPR
jgi:hypothetical protein